MTQEEEDDFEKMMAAMLVGEPRKPKAPHNEPASKAPPALSGLGAVLRDGGTSRGSLSGATGAVSLRVLQMSGNKKRLEASASVLVPTESALARTVIQRDEEASEERQRLKQQILAAAADHEAAPRGYIAQVSQRPLDARDRGGNTNPNWR